MNIDRVSGAVSGAGWSPAAARVWAVGQLLSATVIDRIGKSSIRLDVGGRTLTGHTALALRPGDTVLLKVASIGERPVLLVLRPATSSPRDTVLTTALGTVLPRQLTLPQPLATLQAGGHTLRASGFSAAEPLIHALADLDAAVPQLSELRSAPRLAQAVAESGVLLETILARKVESPGSAMPSERDLKWRALSVLAAASRPEAATAMRPPTSAAPPAPSPSAIVAVSGPHGQPAEGASAPAGALAAAAGAQTAAIERDAEAIVARITTHQIQAAAAADDGALHLVIDLPVIVDSRFEQLMLQIERDAAQASAEAMDTVTATVEVPVGDAGTLRARITLRGQHIDVALGSDDSSLREAIAREHAAFGERLRAAGLEVGTLTLRGVEPVAALPRPDHSLVDERA